MEPIQIRAVRALTPKQKAVWKLVMQQYITEREAATMLGISRDAVHDRLNKARRSFTKFVKENRV